MIRKLLILYRMVNNISHRKMADDIGINHNAYFRIEKGQPVEQKTFIKVLAWLFTETQPTESADDK